MKPTDQQQVIIDHDGNAVVIASPGSGKTFVISQKIRHNLKHLQDHEGVIAISYTNKASNELRQRVLQNGSNPKSSFMGTIDKFFLSEIIIPYGVHVIGRPHNPIDVVKKEILTAEEQKQLGWLNHNIILEDILDGRIEMLCEYFTKGIIFIEAIGVLANYIFEQSQACRNYIKARYKFLYIDEYQDSGHEQHRMFMKINALGIPAVAVGDLNQSIFAFSGKSSKYLEELVSNKRFSNLPLTKNHRCHKSIINYSNYLLDPNVDLIPCDENSLFFFRIEGSEREVANWIDSEIPQIEKAFSIKKRKEIAVLTRSKNTGERINTFLKMPHKLFMSNELDNSLNVWSGLFASLLSYMFDKDYKFVEVVENFTSLNRMSRKEIMELQSCKETIDRIVSHEEEIAAECLKEEFIKVAKIIAPNSRNKASLELLDGVLSNPIELASYKPADDGEVNIMTLHKSKGLEFDAVIHLDLHEWIFPSKRPGQDGDFENPVYLDWNQDINLHYVGITRARKGCFLASSTRRTNWEGKLKNGRDSEFLWLNGINKLRCVSKIHEKEEALTSI